MSIQRKETYNCPNCNHTQEFQFWTSVNAQLSPEANEKILDRTFYSQTCDSCGATTEVVYTFLYNDMENRLMVYVVAASDSENQAEQIREINKVSVTMTDPANDINALVGSIADEYTFRIVTDLIQLIEKIAISKAGLDDRLVEVVKAISLGNAYEQVKDTGISGVYFACEEDGGYQIVICLGDGKTGAVSFEMAQYETLREALMNDLEEHTPKGYALIDFRWAVKVLSKGS